MVIGASYLTYGVTTVLYWVGLVCDRDLYCVYIKDDAITKDQYHSSVTQATRRLCLIFSGVDQIEINIVRQEEIFLANGYVKLF